MRPLRELDRYRDRAHERAGAALFGVSVHSMDPDLGGWFRVPAPRKADVRLRIGAAVGDGWDHLSISLPNRTPTWAEMEHVKRLFFLPDEVAFQLHVPPSDHISVHPHCLHIWRPTVGAIPMPPSWMV